MQSNRRTSAPKLSTRQQSPSKPKDKRSSSPNLRNSKSKVTIENPSKTVARNKKSTGKTLVKKKI